VAENLYDALHALASDERFREHPMALRPTFEDRHLFWFVEVDTSEDDGEAKAELEAFARSRNLDLRWDDGRAVMTQATRS
jgi:hypothetical protein